MRTWSVRGTAFALCTRSSSLSIRTRTSMGFSLASAASISWILRRARTSCREHFLEPPRHRLGDEVGDVAAEGRDLLHPAGRDEAHVRARHDVHRLDVGGEVAVQLIHLELPLEVRDDAQPFHDRLGLPAVREVDDELAEDFDLDVRKVLECGTEELDALLDAEQRLLVPRFADHAHDDTVEDPRRARDHVDVTVRHRVVRAGADRGDHFSYTVTRVCPYLRLVRSVSGSSGCVRASVSTTTTPSSASTAG